MKYSIYKQWLSKYNWDFFTTTTYTKKVTNTTIRNHFDNLYFKNYWIEQLVWITEWTKNDIPHVHCLIKTKDPIKSKVTLERILSDFGNTDIREFEESESTDVYKYIHKNRLNHNSYDYHGLKTDLKTILRDRYRKLME